MNQLIVVERCGQIIMQHLVNITDKIHVRRESKNLVKIWFYKIPLQSLLLASN